MEFTYYATDGEYNSMISQVSIDMPCRGICDIVLLSLHFDLRNKYCWMIRWTTSTLRVFEYSSSFGFCCCWSGITISRIFYCCDDLVLGFRCDEDCIAYFLYDNADFWTHSCVGVCVSRHFSIERWLVFSSSFAVWKMCHNFMCLGNIICYGRIWITGLGIVGLVGSLLAKTYRISKYVVLFEQ